MAKKIDITEKLSMDSTAAIIVAGNEIPVKVDAGTVLKIMNTYSRSQEEQMTEGDVMLKIYDIVFPDESREIIESLNLSFKDLAVLIESAASLVVGEEDDDSAGE